jgi:hypothetical protein
MCCFAAAAVTALDVETDFLDLDADDVLPPNLLQLRAPNFDAPSPLLSLRQLRELTLSTQITKSPSAAELRQLSCLTNLTAVHLTYETDAAKISAAAGGWGALQLRSLHISPFHQVTLSRSTLLQLSQLTGLSDLSLRNCTLDIAGAELAAALAQATDLQKLTLTFRARWSQQQQQQQQEQRQQQLDQRSAAAAAAADADVIADVSPAPDNAAAVAAAGTPLEAFLLGLAASKQILQRSQDV